MDKKKAREWFIELAKKMGPPPACPKCGRVVLAGPCCGSPAATFLRRARRVDPDKAREEFLAKVQGEPKKKRKVPKKPVGFVAPSHACGPHWVWIRLPIWTVNEKNRHEHWTKKADRTASQRAAVDQALNALGTRSIAKGYVVKLTRIAPGSLDRGDNLPMSLSSCRDAVSKWLGIDDGDNDRIEFEYEQIPSKEYGIEIKITPRW